MRYEEITVRDRNRDVDIGVRPTDLVVPLEKTMLVCAVTKHSPHFLCLEWSLVEPGCNS
jgi:hypothetical protein